MLEPEKFAEVKTTLYQPFYDFLKDYMQFFSIPGPVEDYCRQLIYNQCRYLHSKLEDFVNDSTNMANKKAWFEKYSSVLDSGPEDADE